jgi:hypothetical protein
MSLLRSDPRRTVLRSAVATLTVALTLAACGSSAADGPEQRAIERRFCTTWVEVAALRSEAQVTVEDGDNTAITGRMAATLGRIDASPSAISGEARDVLTAFEEAAAGNQTRYNQPEHHEAVDEIDEWVREHCGFTTVDVEYHDYEYRGIPATLPVGPTAFLAEQHGEEPHVMVVYRVQDDAGLGPREVLEESRKAPIPSRRLHELADLVATGGFTNIDDGPGHLLVDLTPGEYFVICPILVGMDAGGVAPRGAEPHFDRGMVATFRVT